MSELYIKDAYFELPEKHNDDIECMVTLLGLHHNGIEIVQKTINAPLIMNWLKDKGRKAWMIYQIAVDVNAVKVWNIYCCKENEPSQIYGLLGVYCPPEVSPMWCPKRVKEK